MLEGVDDLAHRQHHATQFDEILAQPEGPSLQSTSRAVIGTDDIHLSPASSDATPSFHRRSISGPDPSHRPAS